MNVYKLQMQFSPQSSGDAQALHGDVIKALSVALGSSIHHEFARLSTPDETGTMAIVCSERAADQLSSLQSLAIKSITFDAGCTQRLQAATASQGHPASGMCVAGIRALIRL